MIYQLVIALATLATVSAKHFSSDVNHQKLQWKVFKREHGRSYATPEEEATRFGHFLNHLKLADERNEREIKAGGTAVHGITQFSDLSQEEFAQRYLNFDVSKKTPAEFIVSNLNAPTAVGLVDWTGIYTTPVKQMGYCGASWAFAAVEQVESDAIRVLGTTNSLSPEQVLQCDTGDQGCNGGTVEGAYKYIKSAGGLENDYYYPYTSSTGTTGSCHVSKLRFLTTVTGYSGISGFTNSAIESNMASYVQSTGPLAVCLDTSTWSTYTGGIMTSCGTSANHCAQVVGVDASSGGYWKVRGQYGTSWGESGYIRLAYGANTCDITYDPTYTSVANA